MIGIIGAMEEETKVLLSHMAHRVDKQIHHLSYTTGEIYGIDVVLAQSGIGKVNSALATAFMIDHYKPELIINTGSAGGLKKGLQVGDVLVSDAVAYHDVDATAFGYEKGQVPQMPVQYISEEVYVKEILDAAQSVGLHPLKGLIVSSDSFIASEQDVLKIQEDFPEAGATEMEGASIGQTCYVMDTPFVIIRAISDSADEDASVSFDEFIITAGKKSAEMVLAFLANHHKRA